MTDSDATTAGDARHDPGVPAARRVAGWARRLVIPVGLVLLAVLVVGLHVRTYTKIGPIDELQHVDYLYKSPSIVAPGDRVGQDAMREEACRGLDYSPFTLPACSTTAHYAPKDFQELGYNTAAANTPVYYSITHAVAAPIMAVTGIGLVTAGRLVGGLWLAAGLVMAYAAGRRVGVARAPLVALLALVAVAPSVVYQSATITPDASGFAVGAGVLWATLWWEDRPATRWPALVAVAAVAVALKETNVMVLIAVVFYLLLRIVAQRTAGRAKPVDAEPRASYRWLVVGVAGLAVATVAVVVAWALVGSVLGHGSMADVPMNARFKVASLPLTGLVAQNGVFINPLVDAGVTVGNAALATIAQRLAWLFMVPGLVAVGLFGSGLSRLRTLAQGWLIAGLIGGPAFVMLSYVSQSVYFAPPARYGCTLIPGMVVLTASLLRTRPALVVTWGVAALAVGATVLRLA